MAIHIRDPKTDALVRKLAVKEKSGLTEAVKRAVREKLKTHEARSPLHERLTEIADDLEQLPKSGKKADKLFFDKLSGH
jgi:antitoxin VapB